MRKLGVGILGVGEMGRRHAENLRRLTPNAELLAVADVAADRARQVADELEVKNAFGSFEAMLDCKGIDAVVVATPDKFHAPSVKLAAAAGKAILCEKPLALSLDDAAEMLDVISKSGVFFQIGFMRRYDPAYSAAMKRIEAGEIGTPIVFKSVGRDKEGAPLAAYQSGINGMLFYTNTIHDFDLARWLMRDEVSEVQSYTTVMTRPELAQCGDAVASVVNLKFSQGAIGNLESGIQAVYGYDVRTEIVGSKGSIFVGTLNQAPVTFMTSGGGVRPLADHFLSSFADAYVAEIRDFVDSVLSGKPPRVTADDGVKALEIAVAAEKSHRDGLPQKVVPVKAGIAK